MNLAHLYLNRVDLSLLYRKRPKRILREQIQIQDLWFLDWAEGNLYLATRNRSGGLDLLENLLLLEQLVTHRRVELELLFLDLLQNKIFT